MESRALARLVETYAGLPPTAPARLEALLELVAGAPDAPTTLREPRRILADHLADSLCALQIDELRHATSIADVGSGAGFPGLPLAVALPRAEVVMIEASARKCAFIARAISACSLENATVVCARVEAWPEGLGRFDVVTARALAPLAVVAEYAAPLLRVGGTLVAWRGRRDPAEEAVATEAARELGLEPHEPIRVEPYPGVRHRHLHVMSKVGETPARFPRRPGVARKRPLATRHGTA